MSYQAQDIEVLSGLDPVKRRPGMYTDTTRPNHLVQEVIDTLREHGGLAVRDLDGREEHITFSLPKGLRIPTVAVED